VAFPDTRCHSVTLSNLRVPSVLQAQSNVNVAM
jgi:hypothetical protein